MLNNLVDIRVFNFENPLGFRLAFFFKQNEYFADTELTKDYFLKCDPGEEDDPLQFEGSHDPTWISKLYILHMVLLFPLATTNSLIKDLYCILRPKLDKKREKFLNLKKNTHLPVKSNTL